MHANISQPVPFRLWSCRVFGALAKIFPGSKVEVTFFKKAIALCQDTDYEVRAKMCDQLNHIADCVGYSPLLMIEWN
jgi:serine/threonine-protein phosphatase 4 regulatory subunit 4